MATWPATLPQFSLRDGYSEDLGFPVIQAPVDGPALARRRYTAAPRNVSAQYQLTNAQLATFETFFLTTVAQGALSFTAPVRRTGGGTASFRIVEAPQIARNGKGWRLTLKMIQLP